MSYGHPQGFLPLRQQIAASLQGEGVPAHPELSAGIAYEILRIAERHDFLVIEDDTLRRPASRRRHEPVLDRLRRVILVSGYSKMLRQPAVGYVAAHPTSCRSWRT